MKPVGFFAASRTTAALSSLVAAAVRSAGSQMVDIIFSYGIFWYTDSVGCASEPVFRQLIVASNSWASSPGFTLRHSSGLFVAHAAASMIPWFR